MFRLENVFAGYGDTAVVRDVTIGVPSGSVVALLGANGAGKTTLLRAATGLIPLMGGSISLDGEELTGRPIDAIARAGVGHIPEGRAIFPTMTVQENLTLFSPPGGERAAIAQAVDAFPILGERLSQLAGTMSGGEQQMLSLARCYVTDPKVVLVDEVSLGLAPKIIDEIFVFLRRLVEGGAALLLVEQYVARALDLADYVFVLNRGNVVFAGEPGEVERGALLERYLGDVPV